VDLPTFVFPSQTDSLGDVPLLIDAEKPERYFLTHNTYRTWCKRFAAGLIKNGLQPGDRVLLFSGNTILFPCVFIGTMMAEGIFSGANPTYVARELAYQLKDSGARFLITADGSLETSLEAADSIGFPRDRIFTFDEGYSSFDGIGQGREGIRHWSHLLASPAEAESFRWKALTKPEDLNRTVCLNYSSGTTGVPKGVEITHLAYVANTVQVSHNAMLDREYEDKRKKARSLCFLPMYHAYGQTYFCVGVVTRQIPAYIMQKFDFVKMLQHIQRFRITSLTLVPPIAVALAKSPLVKDYDLSSVTTAGCGAAPLGNEVSRELETKFPAGQVNMKQGWGMTEVTCSMCSWHPDEISTSASVGEMNANCEAMLVDENGSQEVTKIGGLGELWVRGPNRMKGYWRKPDATKETLTSDGWLKTGDIAYRDKEGKLFIVDRKKELIKVKGNQVAPAELEALLLELDEIADAAVIGVTIKGEELPRAYVVLKEGAAIKAQDIHKFMETKVSRHKRLMGGIIFTDAIPKNPSGKILRKLLRDQAKAEVGDSEPKGARL